MQFSVSFKTLNCYHGVILPMVSQSIPSSPQPSRYYDLVMALFVTVVIVSNIASSAKIVDWGISLFGLNLAFDAGTILFPVSYIFGDVLTEVYGYARTRRVIWVGFGCLGMSSLIFWIVGIHAGGGLVAELRGSGGL